MTASLLAGCSGGAGGVLTSGAPTTPSTTTATPQTGMSFTLYRNPLQSAQRSAMYIGTAVDTVSYAISPGSINGSIALSSCPSSGSPAVYTCTVGVVPNTYSLTLNLQHGSTVLGTGTASNIVVASGATTAVSVNVNPVNSAPTLALAAGTQQFYLDGTSQTLTANVNERDPANDIISTAFGPVGNWSTLTPAGTGGTAGVTLFAPLAAAPSAATGGTGTITYNGTSANVSSLSVKVSDGTTTSSAISIPFVTLTNNAPNATVTFQTLGVPGQLTITFTEATTSAGSPGLDTQFSNTSSCNGAASFTPGSVSNGAITYTIVANNNGPSLATPGQCTMTVASLNDSNLKSQITIFLGGAVAVSIH